jgi:zinc/manganese transport system substrate-binding protein
MLSRRRVTAAAALMLLATAPAGAQERTEGKLNVVATFSILADVVKNVGGDRIEVASLVGANADTHVYSPTPADAKKVAAAAIVFVNGLGFEGWLIRLVRASAAKAPIVIASDGVKLRPAAQRSHDAHGHDHGPVSAGVRIDPHAWQSVSNVKVYAANVRNALIAADRAGRATYEANTAAYLAKLDALEKEVTETVASIPAGRRRVIVSHNAFGYFTDAYGLEMLAPRGVSTHAEVSAKELADLITQIRAEKISGVFMENVTDPRLIEQIARETGAKVGGTLYSDALTEANGPAPSYIDLMRHNIRTLGGVIAN